MARALVVELGELKIAFPPESKVEVVTVGHTTPLPQCAPLLRGLSVAHGRAVPVVDLAYLLGQAQTATNLSVLAEVGGENLLLPINHALGLMNVPAHRTGTDLLGQPVMVQDNETQSVMNIRPLNTDALLSNLRVHLERL